MKLILLPLLMLLASSHAQDTICCNSKVSYTAYYSSSSRESILDAKKIPFIIGSCSNPEYGVEVRICNIDESLVLSSGRKIAGLNYVILEKEQYIGGRLISSGDSTTITDIYIIPGDEVIFVVRGESFDMNLTLSTGAILKLESAYAIFSTEGRVWLIEKK